MTDDIDHNLRTPFPYGPDDAESSSSSSDSDDGSRIFWTSSNSSTSSENGSRSSETNSQQEVPAEPGQSIGPDGPDDDTTPVLSSDAAPGTWGAFSTKCSAWFASYLTGSSDDTNQKPASSLSTCSSNDRKRVASYLGQSSQEIKEQFGPAPSGDGRSGLTSIEPGSSTEPSMGSPGMTYLDEDGIGDEGSWTQKDRGVRYFEGADVVTLGSVQ